MADFKGADVVGMMENFFKKAPNLPENIREVLVKIAPILSLVFGILGIIGGLAAVGLSPVAVFGGLNAGAFVLVSGLLALVSSVLLLVAYPALNKRLSKGWTFLFWSEVISFISVLLGGSNAAF